MEKVKLKRQFRVSLVTLLSCACSFSKANLI